METNEEFLELIKEQEKNNKISFMTVEGLMSCDIDSFIKQDAQGILYDLNRGKEVIATNAKTAKNKKWINDYAVANVIIKLKEYISFLEEKNTELENNVNLYEEKYKELLANTHNINGEEYDKKLENQTIIYNTTNLHERVDKISEDEMFRI
jgi:hypothetical protein